MKHLIPLYHLGYYFFIYSLLGWLMESTINTIRQKTFVNRGFLVGPYCPIYGVGMCFIYLTCLPYITSLPFVFFNGLFFATLLEYLTGYVMEKLFHAKWWDYSHFKYNLHGYICMHISLAWGILTVLFIEVIHPVIVSLISCIPISAGCILLSGLCFLFFIDLIYSIYTAFKLTAKAPALAEIRREMIVLLEQNNLHGVAEECKLHYKYHLQLSKFSLSEKRLLKAFPNLGQTSIKSIKDKFTRKK